MKKIYVAIFALISGNFYCQTTVSFEDFQLPTEAHFDGSDLSGTEDGTGLFETIYNEGLFTFNSIYDTTWGPTAGYWSQGWAFTDETPDNLTGYAGLFNSYAGGGDESENYVIGQNDSRITKTNDNSLFQSLRITNNNYAASSMLLGDNFAKQFGGSTGDDADFFLVSIVGYDAGDMALDTVKFYLADYRFADNSQDYIIKDWTTVDLFPIGTAKYIKFFLSSSDNTGGYMNTPGFFAIDNVVHSSAIGVAKNKEIEMPVFPNPTSNVLNIKLNKTVNEVYITNLQGQLVDVVRNTTQLDVSNLTTGFYYITVVTDQVSITKKFQKI